MVHSLSFASPSACTPDGQAPFFEDIDNDESTANAKTFGGSYSSIPKLPPGDPFSKGWKSLPFPKRQVVVDSSGGDGFIGFGRKGKARDARFRVVALSDHEIVIDVSDDKIVSGAASWVNEDHLELWAGDALPDWSVECI